MKIDYRDMILTVFGLTLTLTLTLLLLHLAEPLLEASSGRLYPLAYLVGFLLTYGVVTSVYLRVLVRVWPLREGVHKLDSPQFKLWMHIGLMMDLAKSSLAPLNIALTRVLYYKILGVRLGKGVMLGRCNIADPLLTQLQDGAILGDGCSLGGHVITGNRILIKGSIVGKNATVGAHSAIFPGMQLGDNSVIAPLARVAASTKIPPNEYWDGIPAKKVSDIRVTGAKGMHSASINA